MNNILWQEGIKFPVLSGQYYEIMSLLLSVSGMVMEESGPELEFLNSLWGLGIEEE